MDLLLPNSCAPGPFAHLPDRGVPILAVLSLAGKVVSVCSSGMFWNAGSKYACAVRHTQYIVAVAVDTLQLLQRRSKRLF
ncbi:hypothetical protein BS17DRAFT_783226 [Gyrodon lividus]|nr:hypothetical protein BS17DRAFT_783226 [Gyrodon lividus]